MAHSTVRPETAASCPLKSLGLMVLTTLAVFALSGCQATEMKESPKPDPQPASTTVYNGVESPVEEEVIFSFITEHDKKLILAYDAHADRLVYRFFSKDALELELPGADQASWDFFSYMDGHEEVALNGGKIDLNYLVFTNGGYRYEVYDNYNVAGQGRVVGVDVIKISDHSTTRISGDANSAVGSLMLLNEKLPNLKREDLFKESRL